MKTIEACAGAAALAATWLLMALAAFEPVGALAGVPPATVQLAECSGGDVQLAIGCESIHL